MPGSPAIVLHPETNIFYVLSRLRAWLQEYMLRIQANVRSIMEGTEQEVYEDLQKLSHVSDGCPFFA